MNSGATTERIYDALKRQLLAGTIPPGARLDPGHFAEELSSSVTPVRDALNHLTGEGLVEARLSEGFFQPHVHEPALRDLYAWNAQLLRLIIGRWPRDAAAPYFNEVQAVAAPPEFARALFALCAIRSDNSEHARQVEAASDRLSAARYAEMDVLPEVTEETEALFRAAQGSPQQLCKALTAYHRRRGRAVAAIVRAIYRQR